jgi:D-sedoheptulose 7-phosphate isomerase
MTMHDNDSGNAMASFVAEYAAAISRAVDALDSREVETVVDLLFQTYLNDNQVFTVGNGASAALASHMACDLGKGTSINLGEGPAPSSVQRLRVISLVDNVPLLTAYGNDIHYEDVFVEQLKNLLRPGDVLIAISGSGGSPNVLRAAAYANASGATTIGFTGAQEKARKLQGLCRIHLSAPLELMEQIEDLHVIYGHIVGLALREKIQAHQRHSLSRPSPSVR